MKFFLFIFLFYQSLFSQSQIIIKDFNWKIYKTEHFDIYFYGDSELIVPYAAKFAELAYEKGKKEYNPVLNKRIPLFLFASENDMKQNSIVDVGDGTGGFTEPYKDRFVVYNNGSKRWLRDVIFHEFGHVVQFSILVDGWWESPRILKTIFYPLWMMEGMSENMTEEWDIAMEDMYLRDYVINNKLPHLEKLYGFSHLKPHQITLAYKTGSKAMKFLREEYGKDKPSLMLHYFRDAYDTNFVLRKITGLDIEGFNEKFKRYLEFKYFNQIKDENLNDINFYGEELTHNIDDIPVFNKSPVLYNNKLAYISTIKGHPPVVVIEDRKNKQKKILDKNFLDIDNIPDSRFTLPVRSLSASKDFKYLIFPVQKNNREYLGIYDTEKNIFKKVLFKDFLELRQFSFSIDDKKLVFIGMKKGINKIYEIDFKTVIEKEIIEDDVRVVVNGDYDKLSPQYIDDKKIVFLCEGGEFEDIKNDICIYDGKDVNRIDIGLDVRDFYYDREKERVFFISDDDRIYNLYSFSFEDFKIYKHTSLVGGAFTPYYNDGNILVSYFKNGSMNIYRLDEKNIDYVEIKKDIKFENNKKKKKDFQIEFEDYKFKFSTDLFFPALLYSYPGGLFLFLYNQLSDMTGVHNLSTYINYNSYYPYMNLNSSYLYNRYRTKFLAQFSYNMLGKIEDKNLNREYKRKDLSLITGMFYPLTREKSFGFYLHYRDKIKDYDLFKDLEKKRGFIFSYLSNNLNGVYLTAVEGDMLKFSISRYDKVFGGNMSYTLFSQDYINYTPLSRKSTFINRFFAGFSIGKDYPEFSYGGVGGVRGVYESKSGKNIFVYNSELRLCMFYLDYYMNYLFPDFYFKAFYLKLFTDNSYNWNYSFKPKIKNLENSIGFGFNLHSFILQRYQLVLSFDWSFNTKTGSNIMYFYLGPVF